MSDFDDVCGEHLTATCPTCGEELVPRAELTQAREALKTARADAIADAERRLDEVIFGGLSDYTRKQLRALASEEKSDG